MHSKLKMAMADYLIQYNHFNVKHDGNIKTEVQELVKFSVFSRQERKYT